MALETGNYISDLVITNPASTDGLGQADDHLRLIKKSLKNTFPSVVGSVTATQDELNVLDGITASTAELNTLDGATVTTAELNTLDGYTGSVSDFNKLAAVTATSDELNKLDGVVATTNEINKLAGAVVTTAEINKLSGYTGNSGDLNILSGAAAAGVSSTEFRYLDGLSGNIQSQLTSLGSTKASLSGASFTGAINVSAMNAASHVAADGVLERVSGQVYLTVDDNYYIRDSAQSTGQWRFAFDTNYGNFTASGDVTAFSDRRLKEDIETINDALDMVDEMRGVFFIKGGRASVGVIAQEMETVLPEVVHTNPEGYLSVAYGNIVGVLIEAIKELRAEVETLKAGG